MLDTSVKIAIALALAMGEDAPQKKEPEKKSEKPACGCTNSCPCVDCTCAVDGPCTAGCPCAGKNSKSERKEKGKSAPVKSAPRVIFLPDMLPPRPLPQQYYAPPSTLPATYQQPVYQQASYQQPTYGPQPAGGFPGPPIIPQNGGYGAFNRRGAISFGRTSANC